jgi:hypothetical protein
MTATEVVELQGEKAAVLSNMVTNLNAALQKMVQRAVDILFRQGKLPEPPAAIRGGETSMKVDFIGVLAQAQKRAHETSGIMQSIQVMSALAQMAQVVPGVQEAFDYVDASVLLKKAFESAGLSQLAIREDDDVAAIQQQRAQQQMAQAQLQMAQQQEAEVMQNATALNEPVNPDGMLAQIAGAAQGGAG